MRIGLSYADTLDLPLGELLDLIAIYQFKCEGAKLAENEEEDFFKQLERR